MRIKLFDRQPTKQDLPGADGHNVYRESGIFQVEVVPIRAESTPLLYTLCSHSQELHSN